jgi:hypothetical protein
MIAILPMVGVTAIAMVGAGMSFWEGFYFACFVAGLLLSVVSLIGGMGHIHWHIHLPHASHVPVAGHGVVHSSAGSGSSAGRGSGPVPWWNAFSIMVFLCWFGAAGYLMTRYGRPRCRARCLCWRRCAGCWAGRWSSAFLDQGAAAA